MSVDVFARYEDLAFEDADGVRIRTRSAVHVDERMRSAAPWI